jgi:hypothetical protein
MTKTYPKLLGEWVQQHKSTNHGQYLVAFLAVRQDVSEALEEGYDVKTIWEHMQAEGRINFGYHTFLNYVNRQLRRPADDSAGTASTKHIARNVNSERSAKEEPKRLGKGLPSKKMDAIPGFTFNSTPRKEDLI